MSADVVEFVKKLDLPADVAESLINNGFDTMRRVCKIKAEDCAAMGFKLGHTREILEAVRAGSEPSPVATAQPTPQLLAHPLQISISGAAAVGAGAGLAVPGSPSVSRRSIGFGSAHSPGFGAVGSEEKKSLRIEPALTTGSRVLMQRKTLRPFEIKSGELCLRVTKEGELQTLGTAADGSNGYIGEVPIYRLGFPDAKAQPEYAQVPALKGLNVRHACVDKEHTAAFAVTATQLFSWGGQQNYLLGLGKDDSVVNEPTVALDLAGTGDEFCMVDAGQRHAAALTTKGVLYTWGMNHWGAGHVTPTGSTMRPAVPASLKNQHIVYIVCTDQYGDGTLAVTVDGQVLKPRYETAPAPKPDETPKADRCTWAPVEVTMDILKELGFQPEEAAQMMRHVKRASMTAEKRKTMPASMLHAVLSQGGMPGFGAGQSRSGSLDLTLPLPALSSVSGGAGAGAAAGAGAGAAVSTGVGAAAAKSS